MTKTINITYIPISDLKPAEYNPRKASDEEHKQLKKSMKKFGLVDPIIVNNNEKRKNIIIGGHFRCRVAKDLGIEKAPVVYVDIPEIEKEKELNLRLNKNSGQFDINLLKDFEQDMLSDVGFSDREINQMFKKEDEEEEAEVEFTRELLEENNYIVLVFDNTLDWQVAKDKFGIKAIKGLDDKDNYQKRGVGRIVDGSQFI